VCHADKCVGASCAIRDGGVTGFVAVPPKSEAALMAAVARQPVSVSVWAGPLASYRSGILDGQCMPYQDGDHAMLVVGYGEEGGVPFWKLKNSYGVDFGEGGYVRLRRNDSACRHLGTGSIGLLSSPSYPLVETSAEGPHKDVGIAQPPEHPMPAQPAPLPATDPHDLIRTPCGLRPAACVVEAPHGALVRFAAPHEEGDFAVEHSSGRVESVTVPRRCHEFAAQQAAASRGLSTASGAVPDGWIESAGVYQMDPTNQLEGFVGKWTVPAAPAVPKRPETLYYFIGLEDRTQGKLTSIHQPVLTWGDETEGGRGGWHMWSWTCCPKNLTWHSPDIAAQPGAVIHGSIRRRSAAVWSIESAFRNASGWHNTTLTSQVGAFNFNYADVTLETYNVTGCDGLVDGEVEFSELALHLSSKQAWTPPTWYVTGLPNNCETKLTIRNASVMAISSQ